MELVNNFEWTNLQNIFLKNCLFGCFRKVDESTEKFINDIIKLPIIMKLLIKNKGNKASEYRVVNLKLVFKD